MCTNWLGWRTKGSGEQKSCLPVEKQIEQGVRREFRKIHLRLEMFMVAGTTQGQLALREVMDIRQAAEYLGISGDTLYRYASEGFVPAFKLGNRWRFRKSLLDNWMDVKSGVTAKGLVVEPGKKKPVGSAR